MKAPAAGASRTPTKAARSFCRRRGCTNPRSGAARRGGIRDHLLPGNKEYIAGDTIQRPPSGGGGSGSEGSPDGEGEDDFRFALSRDEFVDLFLEDLELPDLAKRRVVNAEALVYHRAGYSVSGSPANLALNRTVRNSLSRRIALRRPKPEELQALRDEIEALDPADEDKRVALEEELCPQEAPHRADPLHRSARRALQAVRGAPEAGRPGGDVLPDGRVRLDDRAHEGPGEAVLRAAVHLPEAALQERRGGVHPPYPPGVRGRRGDLLQQPGNRRHRRVHRAGGNAAGDRRSATARTTGTSTPPRRRTATTPPATTTRPPRC